MSHQPAIDTDDIRIDTTPLDNFDHIVSAEMPWHCIEKIKDRLSEGNAEQTDEQLASLLAQICMDESIARSERDPVWGPQLKAGVKPALPAENEPFKLTFALDIEPLFEWPDFATFEIIRPARVITDELVAQELHQQQIEAGSSEPTETPATTDDLVTLDVSLHRIDSDELILSWTDVPCRLHAPGTPIILNGLVFTGAESLLRGARAGEEKSTTTQPPAALSKDILDSEVKIKVKIKTVERPTPAPIQDVLDQYGTPNEDILLMQIRTSLESRFSIEQRIYMIRQFFEKLVNAIEYTPPKRIINKHLNEESNQISAKILEEGGTREDVTSHLEKNAKESRQRVTGRLKHSMLSSMLQKNQEITMHEGDLQAEIGRLAALTGQRPEELRKKLIDSNQIKSVSAQVIDGKIFDKIMPQMVLKDVDADSLM